MPQIFAIVFEVIVIRSADDIELSHYSNKSGASKGNDVSISDAAGDGFQQNVQSAWHSFASD